MDAFTTLTGIACPLAMANIDTDQLSPARFMTRPRAQGYGGFLLHDVRFDAQAQPRCFILDDPRYARASILVARRNFGTGSSREAAVYALWDYGIRCVNDYIRDNDLKQDPTFFAQLEQLELAMSGVFPYYLFARLVQVVGQKTESRGDP